MADSGKRLTAIERQRQRLAAKKQQKGGIGSMVQGSATQPRQGGNDWIQGSVGSLTSLTTAAAAIPDDKLLGDISSAEAPVKGPSSSDVDDIEIGASIAPSSFAARMEKQGVGEYKPTGDLRFEADEEEGSPPSYASMGSVSSLQQLRSDPQWFMKPVPPEMKLQCKIIRNKGGSAERAGYVLKLEVPNGQGVDLVTVLCAKKKKKTAKSSYYLIASDSAKLARDEFDAKLRANFVGTHFSVFGPGVSPSKLQETPTSELREELAAVSYETNVLGFKGPRRMTVYLPALDQNHERHKVIPHVEEDGLMKRVKNHQVGNVMVLGNKKPTWNAASNSYVLNFYGRVTQASVKNFQLVHEDHEDYIILQFGRVDHNVFTMDFRHPISAIQAFGICLSSFDGKLAVE
eukprot:m.37143 g.37143  ORF g.37143 m.37143 type:complete len:403 (-) comp12479_c0_seq3:78-1286(-)